MLQLAPKPPCSRQRCQLRRRQQAAATAAVRSTPRIGSCTSNRPGGARPAAWVTRVRELAAAKSAVEEAAGHAPPQTPRQYINPLHNVHRCPVHMQGAQRRVEALGAEVPTPQRPEGEVSALQRTQMHTHSRAVVSRREDALPRCHTAASVSAPSLADLF